MYGSAMVGDFLRAGMRGLRGFEVLALLALLLLGSWLPSDALAYGPAGHRLIAITAQARLEPAVLDELETLLGTRSPHLLAEVASWADEVRGTPQWRHTAPWHYLNFPPGDCRYDAARQCADGQCLVQALLDQTALLADRSASPALRADALKFVVHLYGDLHQPLHLGYGHDKGGNQFQLNFPARHARAQATDPAALQRLRQWWSGQTRGGYNLHWLWDSLLLESAQRSEAEWLAALALPEADGSAAAEIDPARLAEAGCRVVQQDGFYPSGHRLAPDYLQTQLPLLEAQLRLGGVRLAHWLNQALGRRR